MKIFFFSRCGVFLFSLILLVLTACKPAKSAVDVANEQHILLKGNAADPADLDPHTASALPEGRILASLFEGLINPDPKDLHPISGVAMDWKISEDGLTYTFFLRPDARWSNGDLLTAHDFVFSYKRVLSPALAAPNASLFYVIEGAESYHKGDINDFEQVGVKALADGILEIRLKQPSPYLLAAMMHWVWFPVHPQTILKHGSIDQRSTGWSTAENIVSNGAFQLKSWESQKVLKVTKNPYYWNKDVVTLAEIHFFPMDVETEERAFRAKQLHVTDSVPASKMERRLAQSEQSTDIFQAPSLGTYSYVFNTNRKPLHDVRVRQALNLAIDRKALAEHVVGKGRPPAYSFTPPETMGYTAEAVIQEDVEKARKLLAEAGYPEGKGFPKLSLLYNQSDVQRVLAEAIQEMWRQNLNISIELESQEWKVYLSARNAGNFDIMRLSWMGDYVDPNAFLDIFTASSLQNYSGWKNDQYDRFVSKAIRTLDQKERNNAYQQAEAILMKELPVMPIHFYNSAYLLSEDVEGWYPNVLDVHPYQYVRLNPKRSISCE